MRKVGNASPTLIGYMLHTFILFFKKKKKTKIGILAVKKTKKPRHMGFLK
jgi:hypothetical protein